MLQTRATNPVSHSGPFWRCSLPHTPSSDPELFSDCGFFGMSGALWGICGHVEKGQPGSCHRLLGLLGRFLVSVTVASALSTPDGFSPIFFHLVTAGNEEQLGDPSHPLAWPQSKFTPCTPEQFTIMFICV